MTKEPVIQDKIHLLMEETGCDQGQAELAMTSAGYDLEKAIRTIGTLLRNIVVVKAKFMAPAKNLYGLVILIADIKREKIFRIRAVVSYNPALFESSLIEDWYDFEKGVYAFRLWEGALQQVTQDLERVFVQRLEGEEFFDILRSGYRDRLHERLLKTLAVYFTGYDLALEIVRQELNLDQFKRIRSKDDTVASWERGHAPSEESGESLLLSVDLQQDPDGRPAREVRVGDSVYVLFTDKRDIAQYLSKLMGGRSETGLKPLPAPVEEIRREKETLRFQVRLSVGILGLAEAQADSLLRVEKRFGQRWWQKLVPF